MIAGLERAAHAGLVVGVDLLQDREPAFPDRHRHRGHPAGHVPVQPVGLRVIEHLGIKGAGLHLADLALFLRETGGHGVRVDPERRFGDRLVGDGPSYWFGS